MLAPASQPRPPAGDEHVVPQAGFRLIGEAGFEPATARPPAEAHDCHMHPDASHASPARDASHRSDDASGTKAVPGPRWRGSGKRRGETAVGHLSVRESPDPFDQHQQLCASPIVKNTKAKNVALRTTERLTWARTMSADCPRDMASWRPAAQSPICSQIHTRRCSHPRMQDGIDDPGPRLASRSGGPRGLGWGFRRAVRGTPAGTVRGLRCSRRNRRSPTRSHTCHSSRS